MASVCKLIFRTFDSIGSVGAKAVEASLPSLMSPYFAGWAFFHDSDCVDVDIMRPIVLL